jgi:branched-chain amino acid transport system substrate-binding protein
MKALRLHLALTAILLAAACTRESSDTSAPAAPTPAEGTPTPAAPPPTPEIKIGQTMPYSGPASSYSTIGKIEAAYFKKLNEAGGVGGRKINFISLDDGYSPPKTVEQVRKLVEQDNVDVIFQALGTPSNSAIHKYVNQKKVPHLFVSSGASKWGDPQNYPWTIGFNPSYQVEGQVYAKHILANSPKAKIAVLYQNDDYGKDVLKGLKDGLGEKNAKMIVKEVTYEVTDPTVDAQIASLKGSKATVFVNIATPKFAAQAIRKVHDIGWKPIQYVNNVAASVGAVLTPAGLDKSVGLLTARYFKDDATDKQWEGDAAMTKFKEFVKQYYPEANLADGSNVYGYMAAQTMEQVLKQCGSDFSRENIMKQAASLKDFTPDGLLPGITMNTSATDFYPFNQLQLSKFDGKSWVNQGEVIKVD